eukprot:gene17849-19632_t
MSPERTTFSTVWLELIAEKRNENVTTVKNYIRCRLNFCLLRCQLLCVRGSRSAKRLFTAESDDITLITSEGEQRNSHKVNDSKSRYSFRYLRLYCNYCVFVNEVEATDRVSFGTIKESSKKDGGKRK